MRLACDRTINGMFCLFLRDVSANPCNWVLTYSQGHSLIIVGTTECTAGYRDAMSDDHTEGFFKDVQDRVSRMNLGEWSEAGVDRESRKAANHPHRAS